MTDATVPAAVRTYEERHRELRAAVRAAGIGPGGHTTAQDDLDDYEERTGPLVDDLVAAVRAALAALAALDEAAR